jgi:hypothetical protein
MFTNRETAIDLKNIEIDPLVSKMRNIWNLVVCYTSVSTIKDNN